MLYMYSNCVSFICFQVAINKEFDYVLYPTASLFAIKCFIFFDDAITSKSTVNVPVFFNYCFFLPTFMWGPILLYRDFYNNVSKAKITITLTISTLRTELGTTLEKPLHILQKLYLYQIP